MLLTSFSEFTAPTQRPGTAQPTRRPGAIDFDTDEQSSTWPRVSHDWIARGRGAPYTSSP
jgi:hypothetical protein